MASFAVSLVVLFPTAGLALSILVRESEFRLCSLCTAFHRCMNIAPPGLAAIAFEPQATSTMRVRASVSLFIFEYLSFADALASISLTA